MNKGSRSSVEDGSLLRRLDGRLEHILDVNHPDNFVEALAVDRETAVLGFGKSPYQIVEGNRRGHADHFAASDADVARGPLAEMQQVAEHLPFGRREIARDGTRILGLVDRFLDLVAERLLAVLAEDQGAHAAPEPRSAFIVPASPSVVHPIGVVDAEAGKRADFAALHVGGVRRRHRWS